MSFRLLATETPQSLQPPAACDVDIPFPKGWRGVLGGTVEDRFVRLRFAGAHGAPAVLALGGISADRFVADEDAGRGWWSDVVRRGGGVDTDRYCLVGADFFPLDPAAPVALCPADYADVLAHALAAAGVARLHAVIGASFGGAIALALARRYPQRVGKLAILCAADRPSAMSSAWRAVQAGVIEFALKHGDGAAGVALARQLAMTTYRTHEEFADRFGSRADIHRYLAARGEDYAARMTAARYLTLSAAIDRADEAPHEIDTPALFIAANSDRLVAPLDVTSCVARYRGPARLSILESRFGHDAFLKEAAVINRLLAPFLEESSDD
jgi:homoserine O-acetyltransferase